MYVIIFSNIKKEDFFQFIFLGKQLINGGKDLPRKIMKINGSE